jgi:Mn-dependent DtxR family transcriptional regulator
LADLLKAISKELKVEPKKILNAVKRLSNPEELGQKEKRIKNLEKGKNDLQSRWNYVEGELATGK